MNGLAFVIDGHPVTIQGGINDAGESKYRVWIDGVAAGAVERTRHSGVGGVNRQRHEAWVHWCWSMHPVYRPNPEWHRGRANWCYASRTDAIRSLVADATRP